VSDLWRATRSKRQIRKDLLEALKAKGRDVDAKYEEAVEHNLDRVKAIDDFEFPVVEIRKDEASDEDVAEIFVRINNQGMRLGQADFVLTLLSVFHGKLRDRIEQRALDISKESMVASTPSNFCGRLARSDSSAPRCLRSTISARRRPGYW